MSGSTRILRSYVTQSLASSNLEAGRRSKEISSSGPSDQRFIPGQRLSATGTPAPQRPAPAPQRPAPAPQQSEVPKPAPPVRLDVNKMRTVRRATPIRRLPSHYAAVTTPHEERETVVSDRVDLSVFAPPEVRTGTSFFVQVMLHIPEDSPLATAHATLMDSEAAIRGSTAIELALPRGSALKISLLASDPFLMVEDPTDGQLVREIGCRKFCR